MIKLRKSMIREKKIAVVLPAYNAEKTLEKTWKALDKKVIDDTIPVDHCIQDRKLEISLLLGLYTI